MLKPLSARLQAFINSLALAPKRKCLTLHECALCACEIRIGDIYRDRGHGRRAHEHCFQAVLADIADGRRAVGKAVDCA